MKPIEMNEDDRKQLETHLRQIPGWSDKSLDISLLEGGITNCNFRVQVNAGEEFVARLCGEGTEQLGINREFEHQVSRIVADLNIAPEVIYFDARNPLLITRFVQGVTLDPPQAARPEMIERIVAQIKRYHDGPDFPGRFSLFDVVRDYHQKALAVGVVFPKDLGEVLANMERIEQTLAPRATLKPCHNDLLAANFIDAGDQLWILDWEYAAMGDPFFDLANFAVNQELDEESCAYLLKLYFGEATPADLAHHHLMRLASDLREAFWAYLQSGIAQLDFDYVEYAEKHMARFRNNFADPKTISSFDTLKG